MTRHGFSPDEVAEMMGLAVETIRREIKRSKLGAVKVGGTEAGGGVWVITQPDLEAYLGKERAQRLIELFRQGPDKA
ncbi:MAG: helix-turn-helix domain-containing protein [Ignavibacteriales bacterium]